MIRLHHRSWIIDYRAVTVDFCDNINSLQTAEKYSTYVLGSFGNRMCMSPFARYRVWPSRQSKAGSEFSLTVLNCTHLRILCRAKKSCLDKGCYFEHFCTMIKFQVWRLNLQSWFFSTFVHVVNAKNSLVPNFSLCLSSDWFFGEWMNLKNLPIWRPLEIFHNFIVLASSASFALVVLQ